MEGRVRPPVWACALGPLIFVIGAPVAMAVFFWEVYQLIAHWAEDALMFDKGAFYLLGVGLGMLALAIVTVQEGWLGRDLSKSQATALSRLAIVGVMLIPILPNLTHFATDTLLKNDGYVVCEPASHQWRFIRDIVYIKPGVECSRGLRERIQGRSQ